MAFELFLALGSSYLYDSVVESDKIDSRTNFYDLYD